MTREWNRRTVAENGESGHILMLERYVGAAEADGIPFEERFAELKETLAEQFPEAEELSALIQTKLEVV